MTVIYTHIQLFLSLFIIAQNQKDVCIVQRTLPFFSISVSPHVVRPGRRSDGYPGAGRASAVTISQSLIGMKRATQSTSLQAGRPIIPMDISFRGTHAGNPSTDLHGLASLTGTCLPECCFSDAYSKSSGACRERRIYIYSDILTKEDFIPLWFVGFS